MVVNFYEWECPASQQGRQGVCMWHEKNSMKEVEEEMKSTKLSFIVEQIRLKKFRQILPENLFDLSGEVAQRCECQSFSIACLPHDIENEWIS